MRKINLDKLLKDHTNYKSLLLKVYKQNREINREISNFLEKSDREDFQCWLLCGYLYLYYYLYLMNSYNTTLESKSIEEFLPLLKRVGNLCLIELQPQSRLVHTYYKLTYNLRDSFCSSLMIYSLLRIFRLVLVAMRNLPLLVPPSNPLSPKVSNQTNNGIVNYNKPYYKCNNYFYCFIYIFIFILTTYNKGELK